MATDPQMLSDWYQSYTAKNPAQPDTGQAPAPATSLTGTPAPPAPQTTGMLQTPAVPQATAQVWKPDANSTVQGQLKNVLDAGGPLMDRATTRAAQQVNQRGLLNSSIGITAGQSALYDAATPIATSDAGTFAAAGKTNAELGTQASISNAGMQNQQDMQMRQIRADAEAQGRSLTFQEQQQLRDLQNQKDMQAAGFKQQTALQDADFAQQSKTQAADLASRYDLANLDVASRERLQQADIANQQKLQAANATLQAGLQASDLAVKQSMQQYEAALKQSMQGLDNENRLKLAQLDADNRTALAKIEAEYKNQLQANSSMATSYQSMVDSFTRVMLDPNLDHGAKQDAIGNLTMLYNNTLKMQSDVSGLKLGELLNLDDLGIKSGDAAGKTTGQTTKTDKLDPWLDANGGGP